MHDTTVVSFASQTLRIMNNNFFLRIRLLKIAPDGRPFLPNDLSLLICVNGVTGKHFSVLSDC